MQFNYRDLLSFVAVCHCLCNLDYEFKVSYRYIDCGNVEFIIDVEVDENVL